MKKVLIIGGAGYVGTELVISLLEKKNNYIVGVYDLFIYENNFSKNSRLNLINGDVRDLTKLKSIIKDYNYIIHLACISNDPSFELNPNLGKDINFSCFEPLVKIAKDSGIEKFIYASSSSVYGVKPEQNVTEDSTLEPITDYSKFKAMCEDVLLKYGDDNFSITILRPATVCGYSKRQRFDLVVNILTNHAYNNRKITIFGGDQMRPNIHIKDMVNSYLLILNEEKNKIKNQIFNVGFENYTVNNLANMVKEVVGNDVLIAKQQTDDNRSYHISSKKIIKLLNFKSLYTIGTAIEDLLNAFQNNYFQDPMSNENYFNIKKMRSIDLK